MTPARGAVPLLRDSDSTARPGSAPVPGSAAPSEAEVAHRSLLDRLAREHNSWRSAFVVGAPDSGKTTFCSRIGRRLADTSRVARVDCDPGQSTLGPPATVGAAAEPVAASPSGRADGPLLRFVGSTSPDRHFLQLAVGVARLAAFFRKAGFEHLVFDSSGYYEAGGAAEFHCRVVDLVEPDHLVALQAEDELEGLLNNFDRRDRVEVHRLPVSEQVRQRSRDRRRRHRQEGFRSHFRGGAMRDIALDGLGLQGHVPDLSDRDQWQDLLVGLSGRNGFLLALGRLDGYDADSHRLRVFAPPFQPSEVAAVAFGTLRLEPQETAEAL